VLAFQTPFRWARCRHWSVGGTTLASSWTRSAPDAVGSDETALIGDAEGGSDRGAHTLRGIPGEWRLFEVTGLS
jgi:hypothetical protein